MMRPTKAKVAIFAELNSPGLGFARVRKVLVLTLCLGLSGSTFGSSDALGTCMSSTRSRAQPPGVAAAQPPAPEPAPPVAPDQKVTLQQAIDIALKNNFQIDAAVHTTLGARDTLESQSAPINPVFSFAGVNNTVAPLAFGSLSNYAITGTIETSGRQRLRTRQARAQLQGAIADAETTRISVRQAVINAFVALQVADSALENEQSAFMTAQRLSDLAEKQFSLGASPETDAIRTSIALTQEAQNLYQAISTVRTARATLNVQMGRNPGQPIDVVDSLSFRQITVKLEDLQQEALATRPEIRSAEANKRALQAAVGLQRSQYYPDLIAATDLHFQQLELGLALPLFDFGSIRGAVKKAKEDVKVQEANIKQARQSALLDVENAYAALVSAQKTVQAYQEGILPRAEALLSKTEAGYKLGASTILDLITAQETLRTTRNAYFASIGAYDQAVVQVERAIAMPVSGSDNPSNRLSPPLGNPGHSQAAHSVAPKQ